MWFDFLNRILEIYWAVTLNINMLNIGLPNFTATSHVYVLWDELILLRVDDWIGMNWNQYFVTFTMNTDAVVEVLEFISRCELHIDVFADAGWNHALFAILNLEESGGRWENMKTLGCWRVVHELHFQSVGFVQLITSKLDHRW